MMLRLVLCVCVLSAPAGAYAAAGGTHALAPPEATTRCGNFTYTLPQRATVLPEESKEEKRQRMRKLAGELYASIQPAAADDKMLLKAIHAQLEKADAEIAAQNWEAADALIKHALAELGDRYVCPDVIDETGMKLLAADLQEREGKRDNAVRVRRTMLAARLAMFGSKTR